MKVKVTGGYLSEHTRRTPTTLQDWPDNVYPPLCTRCQTAILPGMRYVVVDRLYMFCMACDPGA